MARSKKVLSTRKENMYSANSKVIKFFRRNPVIAAEELLGIQLLDYQKYILNESWNKPYVLWACSRNSGKSFLGAVFMLLKAILYADQGIYIIAPTGGQAQETFIKIEEIVLRMGKTAASIASLKDIVAGETVRSPACVTGFTHSPTGFNVSFYNGSEITTLNGKADSNRSRRATLVFFDEAGFSSSELISSAEAFATQDSNFKTSTDEKFNIKTLRKNCPTQLVYASSASDVTTTFWAKYKDFTKRMIAGDTNFFAFDLPCDIAIKPLMNGKEYPPLLQASKVESAMRANKDKAQREYYNKFAQDGGEAQIIKWGTIRRSESFVLPELTYMDGGLYGVAFDPARSYDNSIVSVMKYMYDDNIGYYGKLVNCTNLLEIGSKKGLMMASPDQTKYIRELILAYNGGAEDYKNIYSFSIDPGAGGGGVSTYGDHLLEDWKDSRGIVHKGFLDLSFSTYEGYDKKYPNASRILKMMSPKIYKNQMIDELLELLSLDVIQFPKEYDGRGFVVTQENRNGSIELKERSLSLEEEVALINIDVMKSEMTSIFKFENPEKTMYRYALPKDKERKMHDDRFYTLAMLAHFLFELRKNDKLSKTSKKYSRNWMDYIKY